MGRKTHGPYLIAAIEHNDLRKVNEILTTEIRSKPKIQEFLISDVKRLASEFSEVPLLLAACSEDPTIIKHFVTKFNANINHVHEEGFSRKKKRKTALIEAVRRGLYATVEAILGLNADSNIQDHKGRTALHHAVRKADYRMAKILCTKGAQVNISDKASNSPLHIATIFGHLELVKVLVKFGGDLYRKGQHGAIPIHIAAREGHPSIVRLFCQFEVNINTKVPCYDGKEKAPIHVAAEEGHAETVFAMLDSCEADVGLRDSEGETPLHCCVINEYDPMGMKGKEDYTDTAKVLLNFGADTNVPNRRGETPLHLAARNEFQKVVEVLVVAGSDPLIEDYDHNKPIDLVFPDDTVSRQLLKNAQEEREKYLNEAMEVRARGFTTSIPKSLPLSMRSQSSLSIGMPPSLGSYGRAASVPGLLMQHPNVPPVYEDEYLQPVDHRGNLQDMHVNSVSQANTCRSTHSRSTGSSSSSHMITHPNIRNYADIEEEGSQISRPSRARDRRIGSDSHPPNPRPFTQARRAQSADRLNEYEPSNNGRSLPSPPPERRGQSQPRQMPYNARAVRHSEQSEATSIWEVTPQTSVISTYEDLNDEEMSLNRRPAPVNPAKPIKAATIAKRQPSPMRFLPVGPHGVEPEPQAEEDDDDSYFDDESFDTLDDLSDEPLSQQVQQDQRKPITLIDKAVKSGSQASLHDWLEEQAGLMKTRDEQSKTRPVAQSTPPRGRRGPQSLRSFETATDTTSEFSDYPQDQYKASAPAVPPKPLPRDRNPAPTISKPKPVIAPKPKAHKSEYATPAVNGIQKVIELEVDDRNDPGQTIIRVKPNDERKVQPTPPPRPPKQQDESTEDVPDRAKKSKKTKTKKSKGKKKKSKSHIEENNNENIVIEETAAVEGPIGRAGTNAMQLMASGSGGDKTYDSIKHSDLSMEADEVNQSGATVSSAEHANSPADKTKAKKKKKKTQKDMRQQMFQEDLEKHQEQLEIERREQAMLKQQEEEKKMELLRQREEQEARQQQQEALRQQQLQQQQQLAERQRQQQQVEESDESSDVSEFAQRKVNMVNQDMSAPKRGTDKRTVVFNTEGELKFMLVGGNAEGVFIVHVDPMSDAKARGLQDNDQILKVNGRGIKKRTKEEVRQLISSSGSQVAMVVQQRKDKCDEVMANGGMGDSFFVKALFSHNPEKAGELYVREGDIFKVKDSLPEMAFGSWTAVKVSAKSPEEEDAWKPLKASKKGAEEQVGFIPNAAKAEQLIVRSRLTDNKPTNRGGLFTRSFGRSKSADRFNKAKEAERQAAADANVVAYERVEKVTYQYKRPVVLLGLFCDVVRRQLLYDMPDFFMGPETEIEVPTQSGPVDIRPIEAVIEKNRHCLMIMSPKAIEFVKHKTRLNPIIAYLSPNNKNVIKVVKSRLAPEYDRKVNYMYEEAVKFEKQYAALFTDTVPYTADDSWLPALKDCIRKHQDEPFWEKLHPRALQESDGDDSSPETQSRNPHLQNLAAQRKSKTTDDIPDPIQSLINRHAGGGGLPRGRNDSYDEMASEDYTSEGSESEVDIGMRRPLPHHGGVIPPSQTAHNIHGQRQPAHEYAAPMNHRNMRMRNRSEGDILQYMNADMDENTLINSGRAPHSTQYGNTGRYSGDYNQFQPPPQQRAMRQPHPQHMQGHMHPGGVPAYEYMGGRQQQQRQMPPMMQRRQVPASRGVPSETVL